ncbi:MAG TPA: hypothetical protein P5287_01350 [bacterium]|nr:hypothetical protein [bacterium]
MSVSILKTDEDKKKSLKPYTLFLGTLIGTLAGCLPLLSPLFGAIVFVFAIVRANIVCTVLFFGISVYASNYHYSELINNIGIYVLTGSDQTIEFSRWFTSLPVITYLGFTNTMVMGGAVLGLAAGLPMAFFISEAYSLWINRKKEEKPPETPQQPEPEPEPEEPEKKIVWREK